MSAEDQAAGDAWTVLERRRVFDGSPFVVVNVETVRLPDGRVIDDYYHVELPDFCVAVPVLTDGRILTQWQYKHGAGCVSLTFPAGQIEPGETPAATIARELKEETGYTASDLHDRGSYCVNGNQACARAHLFVATGCELTSEPDHEDLETWELRAMTVQEVEMAIAEGRLAILPHLAAWLSYRAFAAAEA